MRAPRFNSEAKTDLAEPKLRTVPAMLFPETPEAET